MGELCGGSSSRPSLEGLAKLKESFASTFSAKVKDTFAQQQGDAVFTVGEWHSVPLLRNFMSHAGRALGARSAKTSLVHASLDIEDRKQCQDLQHGMSNLVCLDLSGWLPFDELRDGSKVGNQSFGSAGFMSCAFFTIGWARTLMYPLAIESSSYSVALMDMDVILHKDLMQWMSEKRSASGFPLLGGRENEAGINIGVVYSDRKLLPLLQSWTGKTETYFSHNTPDQDALLALLHENPGKHLIIDTNILGMCGTPGEYATHYNCVDNKITAMTQNGHWKPDPASPGTNLRKVSLEKF